MRYQSKIKTNDIVFENNDEQNINENDSINNSISENDPHSPRLCINKERIANDNIGNIIYYLENPQNDEVRSSLFKKTSGNLFGDKPIDKKDSIQGISSGKATESSVKRNSQSSSGNNERTNTALEDFVIIIILLNICIVYYNC